MSLRRSLDKNYLFIRAKAAFFGGIKISMFKLGIMILACGLICLMSTAVAIPHYDWLSPHGVANVHYSGWWHPATYYHYYPAVSYHSWYAPVYYNDLDPWWAANAYGPVRATYYWTGWGW
jgi:hypothetical protein